MPEPTPSLSARKLDAKEFKIRKDQLTRLVEDCAKDLFEADAKREECRRKYARANAMLNEHVESRKKAGS